MTLNTAQRELLSYYRTLELPDELGRYSLEFALTVRKLVDALQHCDIYDILDEPI